jgi:hypothetical protein
MGARGWFLSDSYGLRWPRSRFGRKPDVVLSSQLTAIQGEEMCCHLDNGMDASILLRRALVQGAD